MQKHKILIVLPSLGPGGAERLAVSVANEWTKKGYEVEFIIAHKSYALSDKQGNFQDLLDQDISIHDLKVKRLRDTILPLSRYFKKSKPDVIWVGLWPLTAIAIISSRVSSIL